MCSDCALCVQDPPHHQLRLTCLTYYCADQSVTATVRVQNKRMVQCACLFSSDPLNDAGIRP